MAHPSERGSDEMTMLDHLTELRRRLIWVVLVLLATMVLGFYFAGDLIDIIKERPPADRLEWNVFAPSDSVRIYLQFSFVIGLVFTLPVILYHIWGFVAPGLRPEERKVALSFIPAAVVLFLLGLSFGYFLVFPMVFLFLSNITASLGATETYGIAEFFGFMFNIVLPLGILFELPIVVMFLTRLRILNPNRLVQFRKYAYFLLIVTAVMITPPEIVSDLLVSIPLLFLYEFSLWLSRIVYRRQLAEDAKWAREFNEDTD
jgi:sec-independent protein translocase protein TatC